MAVTETGPMFLKAEYYEGQIKNKFFIADLIKGVVMEVGPQNVVQVITDNAPVCKATGMIVETQYPHIFWTPCVVHTLNLALKNICDAKNVESNEDVYVQCHRITEVAERALMVKNYILNHNMVNTMFNQIAPLKLLPVAETRFAYAIVMLKRFKLLKRSLERLVLYEEWSSYRECDTTRAQVIRSTMLDELWWDKVDYILQFSAHIYDMLRFADTDKPSLHLIYDMWDDMIEKVKNIIYMHERKELTENSAFYDVVDAILIDRWTKSSSPLHCLAHSLNPRYHSDAWLTMAPNRLPPHQDIELSEERNKCFKRYFPNSEARTSVNVEFARFSGQMDTFGSADSIEDRATMDPKMWWLDIINKVFSRRTIEEIIAALEREAADRKVVWSSSALVSLKKASPMSLKISLRSIREGRLQGIGKCLVREFRMLSHAMRGEICKDFVEGCRAILLDKDRNPKWEPSKIELISDETVDRYFSKIDADDWEDLKLVVRLNLPAYVVAKL
ncbi:hypothetical protein OROMI_017740 [Orobanche minor]